MRSKRDEFWDTAPAFEGKTEIWAALKAAVDAATREDQVWGTCLVGFLQNSLGVGVWLDMLSIKNLNY